MIECEVFHLGTRKRFRVRHFLLLLVFSYVVVTLVSQQLKIINMGRQELEIRQEIDEALEQQKILKRQIELLHTDKYVEGLARDELGLVKPGEIIYKYVKD